MSELAFRNERNCSAIVHTEGGLRAIVCLLRSGFHNASYAAQFGVVSYDWSNAKQLWAQDHPMTCEEALTKQAEMVLAEMGSQAALPGAQPRLWVYRNTIKALNWYALQHQHT